MEGRKDDRIIAKAIVLEIKKNTPSEFDKPSSSVSQTTEQRVSMRLEYLKKRKYGEESMLSQNSYM